MTHFIDKCNEIEKTDGLNNQIDHRPCEEAVGYHAGIILFSVFQSFVGIVGPPPYHDKTIDKASFAEKIETRIDDMIYTAVYHLAEGTAYHQTDNNSHEIDVIKKIDKSIYFAFDQPFHNLLFAEKFYFISSLGKKSSKFRCLY